MQGIRFYLEYGNKTEKEKATKERLGNHMGSVIAVLYECEYLDIACVGAIGSLYFHDNSECCSIAVKRDYLAENCKRISEKLAREIHPNLFKYLES